MKDHHESRAVLAIVRERWEILEQTARHHTLRPEVFLRVARECDVVPWIHHMLERAGRLGDLGPEIERGLTEARHKCRMDNLLLVARLEQALDLLLEARITPVVLKGVDLMHRFERGLDTRTLTDVDLLLRAEDVVSALEILERAGWQLPSPERRLHWLRSSHHLPFSSAGPVEVEFEIHWSLVQEGRYRLDPAELIERAQPIDIAGRRVLRLENHDFVAHLFLHHLSHYFDRQLKWVVDLHQVSGLDGFRWETVIERLEGWGGIRAAAMCALHLDKLYPGVIPPSAMRRFPDIRWRRYATLPLRSNHPLELYRGTRGRAVQLYLAAVALEEPRKLPGYLVRRVLRKRSGGSSPVERAHGR
jgi:hypothetical protein